MRFIYNIKGKYERFWEIKTILEYESKFKIGNYHSRHFIRN